MELRTAPPPPPPPLCLIQRYSSTQKGGTLIAGDVMDLASHQRRICDPDGYRPSTCSKCGHGVLHVHDYRSRVLRAELGEPPILKIVRYVCVQCGAVWRVLPRFIARCLWHSWAVVKVATQCRPCQSTTPRVPKRTVRRWMSRLKASTSQLLSALGGSDEAILRRTAQRAEHKQTRRELAMACDGDLARLAMWIHRLLPGIRLM